MNILFVNSARTWGGTEKWTRMAAEALAERHSVRLVFRSAIVGDNIAVPSSRLSLASHVDAYSIAGLAKIIRKERIDVVIPTKRKDYVLAGIASRLCGISNVLRLGIARRLKIPFLHRLTYDILTDGIIVNAEKIREELLLAPFMRAEKIHVIYNGLDTAEIERLRQPAAPKPFAFTVTALGTLTLRKGFDFLIRGFARFLALKTDADAGLVIIGDGPAGKEFSALAKNLGIGDRVVFSGFLKNPYPHLASSDVFAMTSVNEGISNALLEAMYLDNAPVSTRAGGTEEALTDGESGVLVEHGDVAALSGAFDRLYTDRSFREKIAAGAAERVRTRFSLEVMSARLEETLAGIVRKKSGA